MYWSKYNTLFRSERFGPFLFNALSSTLLKVDERYYALLVSLQQDQRLWMCDLEKKFSELLVERKMLVTKQEEEKVLTTRHDRRNALRFNESNLRLTICPTLGCNFRCTYCFEEVQNKVSTMTDRTIDHLINFINKRRKTQRISVLWFGGEPLLPQSYKTIRNITSRIQELPIIFDGAELITNGYLLDSHKIEQLNDLKIRKVQITLDGLEEAHDTRRFLAGGRPTYSRIIANLTALLNSSYRGSCSIRVNVDQRNTRAFMDLRNELLGRFAGKNISVYPGRVEVTYNNMRDVRSLSTQEWSEFSIGLYDKYGLPPVETLFPRDDDFCICSANSCNDFVIGPEGELYKCSMDVGRQSMSIGNISQNEPITNSELVALYSEGTDPYADVECRQCSILPICGGGCANKRLRTKHFGEEGLEFCSHFRENLIAYLERYYDTFLTSKMCRDILNPEHKDMPYRGYQMVQPTRGGVL